MRPKRRIRRLSHVVPRGLRYRVARAMGSKWGYHPSVEVEAHVALLGCELLGEVKVGLYSYANLSLLRNVTIGRFCSIGRRCSIGAALHSINTITTHPIGRPADFLSEVMTEIGNDVWIGDNAVVMPGRRIGDGAIIGAGAVVTKDVAPYAIVVGAPARLLRWRFEPEAIAALGRARWWRYGTAAIDGLARPEVEAVLARIGGQHLAERPIRYRRLPKE
nr:CatB-related O-acetyltransferase [Sphingomonas bacterium]